MPAPNSSCCGCCRTTRPWSGRSTTRSSSPPGSPTTATASSARLKRLDFGNQTRLYDAVHASLDQLKDVEGRKVILLFTDGADFGSKLGSGKALERARDTEVMIYGIGLETEFFNGQSVVRSKPDSILNRFANETGGGYFDLKKDADLNSSFTRIAQELRSQYLIGFSPAALDGKVHRLEVRVEARQPENEEPPQLHRIRRRHASLTCNEWRRAAYGCCPVVTHPTRS